MAVAAGEAEDWDEPAAFEAMARAHAVAGDLAAAVVWRDRARQALASVGDPEDREHIEVDLASLGI